MFYHGAPPGHSTLTEPDDVPAVSVPEDPAEVIVFVGSHAAAAECALVLESKAIPYQVQKTRNGILSTVSSIHELPHATLEFRGRCTVNMVDTSSDLTSIDPR
jgi:hypothetical protein